MKPAGSWKGRPRTVIAVLVLAVAAMGLTLLSRHERVVDQRGQEAVSVVGANLTRLLSWDAEKLDAEVKSERKLLTPSFAVTYGRIIRENIAPAAHKAGLSARAKVVAEGIVENDGSTVKLLYFVNVSMISPKEKASSKAVASNVVGSRIEVTAVRKDGAWLISNYNPI